MRDIDFLDDRGASRNAPRDAILDRRRRREDFRRDVETNEAVMVVAYDHAKNTVDVVIKNDPDRQTIMGVPVLDQGGFFRIYRGLGRNNGTAHGDRRTTGLLVFPKLDARRAFEDFRRRHPPSRRCFIREGGVFIPMSAWVRDPNTPDPLPPNLAASDPGEAHEVAPSDLALVDPDTGAGIIIKPGGRVVVTATNVDFIRIGETEADLATVARAGESGGDAATTGTAFIRSTT